ncbi:LysR substrate-binding domain-containing protein [Ferrimonas marina]|uniref:DNA-binding transcriptional regulator, LysR family n=1 Tax=Ferrimonas marina TaxID=299255 RepID=A0A1M5R5A7_9GAMM|nr:LysR substrate-binding domain-containing protein [Ferrimonas marina]SHH21557.1 DNA-binding transcriptional regulator, LysR family [Ferrimonas marina]
MRYTLKQLAVFDAIASRGSVSLAAEQLSLTQSATSMSLSQLEKMLGKPLFERVGKRMVLTHWGQWLRPKAKGLLGQAEQIQLGFSGQHLVSGNISVGASQTSAHHLVPDLISKTDKDFPEVRIQLEVENTEHVIEGVLDHRYQLGIIEGRCDDSRLLQQTWCNDQLAVVAGPHHPYARLKSVSLGQLEQAEWVLREQGAGTRAIFDAAIHGHIDNLNVRHEYEQISILKTLVQQGPYLSCLPVLDVERAIERDELVALKVPELNMTRRLSFIWRRESADNPVRNCLLTEGKRLERVRALQ